MLGHSRGDTAERAVAKEHGVGTAAEIEALDHIAVVWGVIAEVISLPTSPACSTHVVGPRAVKNVLSVATADTTDRDYGIGGPVCGFEGIVDAEGVDKLSRDDGVSDRCVAQVRRESPAGERRGRHESGVTSSGNLKG